MDMLNGYALIGRYGMDMLSLGAMTWICCIGYVVWFFYGYALIGRYGMGMLSLGAVIWVCCMGILYGFCMGMPSLGSMV